MAHYKVTFEGYMFDKQQHMSAEIPFIIGEPIKSLARRARAVAGFSGYSTSPAIVKDDETILIIFHDHPNKNAKSFLPGARITISLIK